MSSEDLVKQCVKMQKGDTVAFAKLYTELYTPLYRFIYGLTFSRENTEDLVQEVFIKMANAIQHFKGGNVLAWLFTIARNAFYDSMKKRHKEVSLEDSHEEVYVKHEEELEADNTAQLRALHENMKQLSEHERELLMYRYWHDLNMKQIAAIVGKTHEAVRQELSRLIKKLRKQTWATN
jgi:RNA polymerase sigma-70 factor (ECF subfamily)